MNQNGKYSINIDVCEKLFNANIIYKYDQGKVMIYIDDILISEFIKNASCDGINIPLEDVLRIVNKKMWCDNDGRGLVIIGDEI